MKLVKVGKTNEALVDDEDFPVVSRYRWFLRIDKKCKYAFAIIWVAGRETRVLMHRLIMGMRSKQIDHANRNGLDNQKSNLRWCTPQQNCFNRTYKSKNRFKGVTKKRDRWRAQAMLNRKQVHIGTFDTEIEAAKAYDRHILDRNEFAILNFPFKAKGGGK